MEIKYLLKYFQLPNSVIDVIYRYAQVFETKIPHQKNYEIYWHKPFPEGIQRIYILGGNTDSSDFGTALNTNKFSYKDTKPKFTCYEDLAKYLYKHRNAKYLYKHRNNKTCPDECEDCKFCYRFHSRYGDIDEYDEDELTILYENNYYKAITNSTSHLELFTKICEYFDQKLDQILMIRKYDPVLRWLIDIRRV